MGVDKAFDKQLRITEEQKAKTVQHWQRTGLSYTQLGEWCKEQLVLKKSQAWNRPKDTLKPYIWQSMMWMRDAWRDVTKQTKVN